MSGGKTIPGGHTTALLRGLRTYVLTVMSGTHPKDLPHLSSTDLVRQAGNRGVELDLPRAMTFWESTISLQGSLYVESSLYSRSVGPCLQINSVIFPGTRRSLLLQTNELSVKGKTKIEADNFSLTRRRSCQVPGP